MAAKKLIQTIEGATDNTVVYENEDGLVIAVTRPKIIALNTILAELGFDVPEKKKRAKKGESKPTEGEQKTPSPDKAPNKAPNSLSNADSGGDNTKTQPSANGAQKGK